MKDTEIVTSNKPWTQEEIDTLQREINKYLQDTQQEFIISYSNLMKEVEVELDKQHPITKEIAITDVYPVELDSIEEENNGSI